jgi:stalled ribosome rescue protein Dom34
LSRIKRDTCDLDYGSKAASPWLSESSIEEGIMPSHYHAVVWMDHLEARVFHFSITEVDQVVLHPHNPTRHIHHKANTIGSGHAAEDHEFLLQVADAIADAGAVLVTGPAKTKNELVKHIARHAPQVSSKIAGVETLDRLTDGELVAHARTYFKSDHQVPPRRR